MPGILDRDTPLREVNAAELLAKPAADLPIDAETVATLQRAEHVRSVQVIDGTTSGNLTAALAGRHVGTAVSA